MHTLSKALIVWALCFCGSNAMSQGIVRIEHCIQDSSYALGSHSLAYTCVDHAVLRSEPDIHSQRIATFPIGTSVELIRQSTHAFALGGVESPWYWVKYQGSAGWIWGGLMTTQTSGSHSDPEVKFLLSYGAMDSVQMGDYFTRVYVADLRAVRNKKMLDRELIKIHEPMMKDFTAVGTMGLKGVDDLLRFSISGESCGHFNGQVWLGWDGSQFTEEWVIGGVPDGEFYEGEEAVFPIAMEGLIDTVLVKGTSFEQWFELLDMTDEQGNEVTEMVVWKESQRKVILQGGQWLEVQGSFHSRVTAYTLYTIEGSKMYLPENLPANISNQLIIHRKNQN